MACSGTNVGSQRPTGSGGDNAGGAGGASMDPAIEIVFVPEKTTPLKPTESRELTVQAMVKAPQIPAAQLRIRFALLGGEDAVLESTEVLTDDEGIAHVTVIAPSKPTSFDVRASSSGGGQVRLSMTVNVSGMTSLLVHPSYGGQRPITKWTASAQPGVTCSQLAGNPPSDGSSPVSAKVGEKFVLLPTVPVDVDLAVTVRAGHYISGCVNLPALSEVDGNQVLVYASDRALNLAATNLTLSFGASDAHPAFDKLLQASARVAEDALLGSAKSDVEALFDGMREAAPEASLEAFDVARTMGAWDSALESAFGKSALRRLRDPAQRWLSAGLLALNAPDALIGKLAPLSSGATFTPSAVATASPGDAGLPGFFVANWSADSNDTVLLGMELNWEPSRLVTALAVAPALLEFPEATRVEQALALSVDCAQVGELLLANGTTPGSAAFASCDASCIANLCSDAVATAWSNAQLSSGAQIDTLSVTGSGAAQVGDDARATGLSGSWVGELRTESATAPVSGALSASSSSR